MKYATAERVEEIFTQFGADLRKVEHNSSRYCVTYNDSGEPVIICEWAELPAGQTINNEKMWWVRRWEAGQPLTEEFTSVIELSRT